MRIIFSPTALEHYEFWKKTDGKITEKIKSLLRDMSEHPFTGIGKPEPLKGNLRGVWSRRITSTHRLLYEVNCPIFAQTIGQPPGSVSSL